MSNNVVFFSLKGCHVFEECDGVTRLEALDYHNNDTIRHQASELLDVYFYGESQVCKILIFKLTNTTFLQSTLY